MLGRFSGMKWGTLSTESFMSDRHRTNTVLTASQRRQIRREAAKRRKLLDQAADLTPRRQAERFGCDSRTIDRLLAGETWGDEA